MCRLWHVEGMDGIFSCLLYTSTSLWAMRTSLWVMSGMASRPLTSRMSLSAVMFMPCLLYTSAAEVSKDTGKTGVYYWEPVGVPGKGMGTWFENMGMFDEYGRALPGWEMCIRDRCICYKGIEYRFSRKV